MEQLTCESCGSGTEAPYFQHRNTTCTSMFVAANAADDDGLGSGAIAGIVILILVAAALLVVGIIYRQRKQSSQKVQINDVLRSNSGGTEDSVNQTSHAIPSVELAIAETAVDGNGVGMSEREALAASLTCYHGVINRQMAEDAIRRHGCQQGAFLIRSKSEDHVLSLFTKKKSFSHNIIATTGHPSVYLMNSKPLAQDCTNLAELIAHLSTVNSDLSTPLTTPVPMEQLDTYETITVEDGALQTSDEFQGDMYEDIDVGGNEQQSTWQNESAVVKTSAQIGSGDEFDGFGNGLYQVIDAGGNDQQPAGQTITAPGVASVELYGNNEHNPRDSVTDMETYDSFAPQDAGTHGSVEDTMAGGTAPPLGLGANINTYFETPVDELNCIHVGTDRAAAENILLSTTSGAGTYLFRKKSTNLLSKEMDLVLSIVTTKGTVEHHKMSKAGVEYLLNGVELTKECKDLHAIVAHLSKVQDIVSTVLTTPVNISQRKSTYVPGIGSVDVYGNDQGTLEELYEDIDADTTTAASAVDTESGLEMYADIDTQPTTAAYLAPGQFTDAAADEGGLETYEELDAAPAPSAQGMDYDGGVEMYGNDDTYEAFGSALAPGSKDMNYEGGIEMYGNETTGAGVEMYGNDEAPPARKNTVDFYGNYEGGVDMYDETEGPNKQISIYGSDGVPTQLYGSDGPAISSAIPGAVNDSFSGFGETSVDVYGSDDYADIEVDGAVGQNVDC